MKIKVLGSGCANCHKLHEEVVKAVNNLGKDYDVEYITDINIMLSYGIMSAPAIVVDDKVVSQGRVLKAKGVEKLLTGLEIEDDNKGASCGCSCGGNF